MSNYLPDARYAVTIDGASFRVSKSGSPSISLALEGDAGEGRIFHDLYLTEKTKERTAKTLAEFGFDTDEKVRAVIDEPSALVGMKATILTNLDEWQGKQTVKVRFLNGPHRSNVIEITQPSPAAKASALALFGGPAVPLATDSDADADPEIPF